MENKDSESSLNQSQSRRMRSSIPVERIAPQSPDPRERSRSPNRRSDGRLRSSSVDGERGQNVHCVENHSGESRQNLQSLFGSSVRVIQNIPPQQNSSRHSLSSRVSSVPNAISVQSSASDRFSVPSVSVLEPHVSRGRQLRAQRRRASFEQDSDEDDFKEIMAQIEQIGAEYVALRRQLNPEILEILESVTNCIIETFVGSSEERSIEVRLERDFGNQDKVSLSLRQLIDHANDPLIDVAANPLRHRGLIVALSTALELFRQGIIDEHAEVLFQMELLLPSEIFDRKAGGDGLHNDYDSDSEESIEVEIKAYVNEEDAEISEENNEEQAQIAEGDNDNEGDDDDEV